MNIDEILKEFEDINHMYNNSSKLDTLKMMLEELGQTNTAEWIIVGKTTFHYECSICGGAGDKWDKFCKHCGAKMKESEV